MEALNRWRERRANRDCTEALEELLELSERLARQNEELLRQSERLEELVELLVKGTPTAMIVAGAPVSK